MNNLTKGEAAAIGTIFGGLFVGAIVFYVLTVIASWRIFKKAGEKGWKSLIPIYNMYIMYKIVGMKNWFWASLAVVIVSTMLPALTGSIKYDNNGNVTSMDTFATVLNWASMIFSLVVSVLYAVRLAKVVKKGTGFTIGLVLLPNIFWLILAFGSAKYDKKALKA